jgi:hypothetical protein
MKPKKIRFKKLTPAEKLLAMLEANLRASKFSSAKKSQ